MSEIIKLIEIAKAEEGYLEKKSNKNLDSKTENAGSNNYTKYARDLDNIPKFYNGKKNGYAWCDVFVDWCFVQAFGVDRAKELLCQPDMSLGAGCYYSAQYYKSHKKFDNKPSVGDQIFFKNSGGSVTHTGLVYKVDDTYVYTVEGNTSSASGVVPNGGCVRLKKYKLNYKYIYGYGRPAYNNEVVKTTYQGIFPKLPLKGYFKKGDKGEQVKYLQKFLNWSNGCNLDADGSFGPLTNIEVGKFQRDNFLVVDYKFGKKSLARAKEIKR